jgi:predicted RNA-binding Zn ribbon-like protein
LEVKVSYRFELSGGSLSLDFANTVSGSRASQPKEHLKNYGDLISWARQAGIVSEERARTLSLLAEKKPEQAALVLGQARELREAIYRIWVATVRGSRPAPSNLTLVNRVLATALEHRRLLPVNNRLQLGWADEELLDSVLWPVVQATVELFTSPDAERVRICEAVLANECDWLFLDLSRNRSRRWCSMKDCGNRAKARRHYQRKRQN